jgi:ADP-heptose:LPS heptosyltransferase
MGDSMKIVLFPWAKRLRDGKNNPKNYPWWPELVTQLQAVGHNLVQVGVDGEEQIVPDFRKSLTIAELTKLMRESDTWIGVDSFGQHLGWDLGIRGIAIFGQSDPNIFGHPENINLLKSRNYLREQQFWWWEQAEYRTEAFVEPDTVIRTLAESFK